MNDQNHKCEACRRSLPMNMFSLDRSRASGHNPRCKDCDNYRRRNRYRRSLPKDADILKTPLTIYPLREHNRSMIESALSQGWFLMDCWDVNTRDRFAFSGDFGNGRTMSIRVFRFDAVKDIERDPNGFVEACITDEDGMVFGLTYTGHDIEDFMVHILASLQKRNLRLESGELTI